MRFIRHFLSFALILIAVGSAFADFPVENDEQQLKNSTLNKNNNNETVTLERRVINGVEANPENWKFLVAVLKPSSWGPLFGKSVGNPNIGNFYNNYNQIRGNHRKGRFPPPPPPQIQQRYSQSCGATLITPDFVLTAGHCVVDENNNPLPPSSMIVRIGAHQLSNVENNNVDDVEVSQIFIRDEFDVSRLEKGNDLALLKLKRPVIASPTILSAAMPPNGLNFPTGTPCVSAGWGVTETGKTSDLPLEVDVPIYDFTRCSHTWNLPNMSKDGRILCAIAPDWSEDTCYGDSGGPLVCRLPAFNGNYFTERWVLAGVVSFGGSKCAQPGVPGMYTSVSYHMPWIMKIVNGQQTPS